MATPKLHPFSASLDGTQEPPPVPGRPTLSPVSVHRSTVEETHNGEQEGQAGSGTFPMYCWLSCAFAELPSLEGLTTKIKRRRQASDVW